MIRRLTVGLALLTTAAACGGGAAAGAGSSAPGAAVVVKVVDGDTVRVKVGGTPESVRLIGIDTPETHGPGGLRECFGQEATRYTASLLPPGTEVVLVRDTEGRDRYGRLLAYVYRRADRLFVNVEIARAGFASPLTVPPNVAHTTEFVTAAAEARQAGRGLWATCGGTDTPI